MVIGMTFIHPKIRWRVTGVCLLFLFKLMALVCISVKSINESSKNLFLIQSIVQTFLSLIVLGLFVNEWTDTWPSETGISKDMTVYGKWLYIIFMISSKVALLSVALEANIASKLFAAEIGVFLALEFTLQTIALFVARDVFSGRTNEGFLVEVSAKKHDAEKHSDAEMY